MTSVRIIKPPPPAGMASSQTLGLAPKLTLEVELAGGVLTYAATKLHPDLVTNDGWGPSAEQLTLLKAALREALLAIDPRMV